MTSSTQTFARIRVRAPDPDVAERASAEVFEAGAAGLEEQEGEDGVLLIVYAGRTEVAAVLAALSRVGLAGARVEAVPDEDWSRAWRAHLHAVEISERLVIRPSFVRFALASGQRELVIDPGQAFGTGGHESTRLALEWVAELAPSLDTQRRVLDVGIGTGVLALGALVLSPARAVGFDLDPLAGEAALANARANGMDERLACFTGGIDALSLRACFDLVLVNLLRGEVQPILPAIARRVARGGGMVLSGLLEGEANGMSRRAAALGLSERGRRRRVDASDAVWASLHLGRAD